jgi:hypothetical protein
MQSPHRRAEVSANPSPVMARRSSTSPPMATSQPSVTSSPPTSNSFLKLPSPAVIAAQAQANFNARLSTVRAPAAMPISDSGSGPGSVSRPEDSPPTHHHRHHHQQEEQEEQNRHGLTAMHPTQMLGTVPPPTRKDTSSSISTQATTATTGSAETNTSSYSAEASPNSHQSIFSVKDGSDVSNIRRTSRRRTGPLSQQSRERAALIRKLGACNDCRRRRVAVST